MDVAIQLGNWGARWLELSPEDYDPFVVLWAWKMHVLLDRLAQPRIRLRSARPSQAEVLAAAKAAGAGVVHQAPRI